MFRLLKNLGHAVQMMVRNIRNYAMLSLSVVLSFSVLLGYLCFTDATLYNQYKEVLSKPEQLVIVQDEDNSDAAVESLIQLSSTGDSTHYIMTKMLGATFSHDDLSVVTHIYSIPTVSWGIYDQNMLTPLQITWLNGRDHGYVSLNSAEVIVSRNFYELYGLAEQSEPIVPVGILIRMNGVRQTRWMECRVVGIMETATDSNATITDDNGKTTAWSGIYLSQQTAQEILKDAQPEYPQRYVIFYTRTQQIVMEAADETGMFAIGAYKWINAAKEELALHARTKLIIVLLLFVLLGINLYGSFSNALEKRRFEVGVKRALGASKFDIVWQFLGESLLLMLCNAFMSILVVSNVLLVYKYIYQLTHNDPWTIYLSGTSAAMFAVVCLALTMLFSGIFAAKATQVQIVDYLKAE